MHPCPDTPLPSRRPRQRGELSRASITNVLRDRQDRRAAGPTLDELVAITGLSKTAVRYHVAWLTDAGIVRLDTRREVTLLPGGAP